MKSAIGVSTNAGHSAVDLMPSPASSLLMAWVNPITAAFVALYTDSQGRPLLPEIDDVLTTRALPCSAPAARSRSRHSRYKRIIERMFVLSWRSTRLVV